MNGDVITISELTEDEITKLRFRKGFRRAKKEDLEDDTKYANVLLKLAPGVTQDNYAVLKDGIVAITGIQDVMLLVDFKTWATVRLPENHTQFVDVTVDVDLRDDTPRPPELE